MCKLEVWIVALRMLSLGLVLGFVAPALLVLLPNSAAGAAFHGDSTAHRQPFKVHEPGFRLTATAADSAAHGRHRDPCGWPCRRQTAVRGGAAQQQR